MNNASAYNHYQSAGAQSAMDVDPHRLIEMLFGGLLGKLARARVAAGNGRRADFGNRISEAMDIVAALRSSLNLDEGGEIARQLDDLYQFMIQRLLEANLRFDASLIEEVSGLVGQIKSAWDGIRSGQLQ